MTDVESLRNRLDAVARRSGHSSVLASMLAGQIAREEEEIRSLREEFGRATFEDGWYQIERKGERQDPATGNVLVFDDENIRSIVDNFNAQIAPGFPGMPVKCPGAVGLVAPPAGRAMRLEARADGVWGFIVWERPKQTKEQSVSINL